MYKKYHNMLQVVLAASPSSGGLNKTTGDLKEEIKNFYINDELFIGDKMVSNFQKQSKNKWEYFWASEKIVKAD